MSFATVSDVPSACKTNFRLTLDLICKNIHDHPVRTFKALIALPFLCMLKRCIDRHRSPAEAVNTRIRKFLDDGWKDLHEEALDLSDSPHRDAFQQQDKHDRARARARNGRLSQAADALLGAPLAQPGTSFCDSQAAQTGLRRV